MPVWVLFLLIGLLWIAYMFRPFLRVRGVGDAADERSRLLEEKRGYLYALRDAEIDYRMGKLSEEDYLGVRDRLEERAAGILRKIDQRFGGSPEQKVETALDRLRKRGA